MTPLRAALALLVAAWAVLALGLGADAGRGGPESTIAAYLADLEAQRVDAALAALSPSVRPRWRNFLDFQQYNRYRLISLAVRSPSLLDALLHGIAWRATEATLVADITEPSGIRWRASSIIPLERADGGWYLERPPFATD